MMRRLIFMCAAMAALLAACGSEPDAPGASPATEPQGVVQAEETEPSPSARRDETALQSRDCGTVLGLYADALAARDFVAAARVWGSATGVDAAILATRYADYGAAQLQIGDMREEGAAGSLYCTAKVTLLDSQNSGHAPRRGVMNLRRANDVPGATPEQLRWSIFESTLVEDMERVGESEPA